MLTLAQFPYFFMDECMLVDVLLRYGVYAEAEVGSRE
jgi:hypothetical protein